MEVADPERERVARRARRVVRAFRLIFYPGAAVIAAMLLLGRERPPAPLEGRTQQHRPFQILVLDGRPTTFTVDVDSWCSDGARARPFHWYPSDGPGHPFAYRGGVLDVRRTYEMPWSNGRVGRSTLHLQARVHADSVTGTVSIVQRQGSYVCESGPVEVTAQR